MNKKNLSFIPVIAYSFFAAGQVWLYLTILKEEKLYERVTNYGFAWFGSHVILCIGSILAIWVAYTFWNELRISKSKIWALIGYCVTLLGLLASLAQFGVDFWLTYISKFGKEEMYVQLNNIRQNNILSFLIYDMTAFWLLGIIFTMIACIRTKQISKLSIGLFILGLMMLLFGDKLHLIIERLSYLIIGISFYLTFKIMSQEK